MASLSTQEARTVHFSGSLMQVRSRAEGRLGSAWGSCWVVAYALVAAPAATSLCMVGGGILVHCRASPRQEEVP